jgi:DNA repair protein RadC
MSKALIARDAPIVGDKMVTTSDYDLWVDITGSQQAASALSRMGLPEVMGISVSNLTGLLTERQVRRVAAVQELLRRAEARPLLRGQRMNNPRLVYEAMKPLSRLDTEQFWVLLLDARGRVLRRVCVSSGNAGRVAVVPRDVFTAATAEVRCAAIILVHNHPSGDPTASSHDIALTDRLVEVGRILGIGVADHVIVGDGSYTSMAEQGLMGGEIGRLWSACSSA